MTKFWLIAVPIFATFVFVIWRLTIQFYNRERKSKMWSVWGIRRSYWEGVLYLSGILTSLVLVVLKSAHLLG